MVRTHGVRPWNQCLKSCFLIIWQLLAPFTSQPRVHKWAGSTTGWVLLWNRDSGADTWCPAMEPMSQIMFFNHLATFGTIHKSAKGPQVGRFHNGMGPVVEPGQWCGHMVSAMEPMSQIMFFNHLATFGTIPSQPRVHKWAGSTTGWVLLWNRDSGADTWCPAMEPMSQIMFFNHLATFGTIYKSAKGPQVGRFHNVMGPVVEQGQWCGHLLSSHGTNVANHVL